MKPETKFRQSKVIPFLKTLKNTKYFSIQQKSISGTPDILLCMNGKFVALELKKDGLSKISELQKYNLSEVTRTKGTSFLAFPEIWDVIKGYLQALDRGEL